MSDQRSIKSVSDPVSVFKTWGWPIGSAAGGLLMGLAPVNAWPLAWIGLVPLWLVVTCGPQRKRSVLGAAVLWGVAYHGTALSWITGIHPMTWMGVPWLGSVAIALFSLAFITLWGAGIGLSWAGLMMWVSQWYYASNNKAFTSGARVLVGTALWCAVEWVWSKGPLYWTSLSYTQSPHNLLALQLGQLAGPITVTAAIVAVNGLIAEAIGEWLSTSQLAFPRQVSVQADSQLESSRLARETRFFGYDTHGRYATGRYAIALFLTIHLVGWGLYAWPLADRADEQLAVGLVQGNIPTSQKMTGSGVRTSRQVYLDGYEALAAQGAQIVITPEGSIPQLWNSFLQSRDLLQRAVVKNRVPLVLGTFAHADIDDSQTPTTQSLLVLTPGGKLAGRYNKVKLVPLGEYMPLENILGEWVSGLSPFGDSMKPGRFDQRLETPFGPMAAGICYESAFAELFRQQVGRGGQAIFTASNNDPYSSRQMMQHHAQDVMRAIETNRWEVRVTNTGLSGVVDPKGRTRWLSSVGKYTTHVAQIYRRQTKTPYVRWGDWLTPLLLVASAVILRPRK